MKGFIFIICLLVFTITSISGLVWDYQFDRDCGDYLKLAGDAPTVERAHNFLEKAVDYIEAHGLTQGNTGMVFHRTTDDLGIWYGNILGAKATLDTLILEAKQNPQSVSQLTRDNALMKIREVVLDHTGNGQSVTGPDWVSMHPHQSTFWILFCVSFIVGGIMVAIYINTNSY
ncbi:MAG: hypothetical protein AAB445_00350 [Patescibacteria group bacterium]